MEESYDGSEEEQIFYDTVREYVVSIQHFLTPLQILRCTKGQQKGTFIGDKRICIVNVIVNCTDFDYLYLLS